MHAGPAVEELSLGAAGLQRLDHVHAVDGSAGHLALLLEQAAAAVLPGAGYEPQRQQVDGDHGDRDQRQGRIVGEHDGGVDQHGEHVDRVGGELAGDQRRDLVVGGDPVGDVAGETLAEEGHRQGHDVAEEARGRDQGELRLHPGKAVLLQPGERALHDGGGPEADQERQEQGLAARDEHVVHEHLGDRGDGEAGDHQDQGRRNDVEQCRARVAEAGEQAARDARRGAAPAEIRAGGEGQAYPREPLVELLHGKAPRPFRRVVDVDGLALDSLQDDEMVEVPEDDHREREVEQAARVAPVALRGEAVLACGPQYAGRLAAVARHAATHPQLFERHPPAVVREHHAEGGGAALRRLHLEEGGSRPPPAALAVEVGPQPGRSRTHYSAISRGRCETNRLGGGATRGIEVRDRTSS